MMRDKKEQGPVPQSMSRSVWLPLGYLASLSLTLVILDNLFSTGPGFSNPARNDLGTRECPIEVQHGPVSMECGLVAGEVPVYLLLRCP